MKVGHKNLTLQSILVHFPNQPETLNLDALQSIDLESEPFVLKLFDFGLRQPQQTHFFYSELVFRPSSKYNLDTWALGLLMFELLTGVNLISSDAPHALQKVGKLSLSQNCLLFLYNTLQIK